MADFGNSVFKYDPVISWKCARSSQLPRGIYGAICDFDWQQKK